MVDEILPHQHPDEPQNEHKAISPLRFMLMQLSLDDLFAFLHRMHLRYMLKCGKDNHYRASIQGYGTLRYSGVSEKSPKAALTDALAKFLVKEEHDYHEYSIIKDPNASLQAN